MKKNDYVRLTEEEISSIKALIDDFENEDKSVRERMIRTWKKLEWFWNGFTQIYWSDTAHDWRIYGTQGNSGENDDNQAGYYDKNINVFRAYLETIIAALSATVPPIKCYPDDVDNPSDISTARGGEHIASLIYKHVDAPLLWVKMLWVYCLQGLIAVHTYTDEDKSYGEVELPESEDSEVNVQRKSCPICGTVLQEDPVADELKEQEEQEFDPDDEDSALHGLLDDGKIPCSQCMIEIDPEITQDKVVITRITGTTKQAKTRQKMEVNGGLFVKVPVYARNQAECPYVALCHEEHFTTLYEKYPSLQDDMGANEGAASSDADGNQIYERWGRLNPQYRGEYPLNTPTERQWWLRRATFNAINDEDIRKSLKKKFPDGCYAILVNDKFVGACNENLDDHWSLSINPMSNYLHYDPLAVLVTAVQEITADLISLELQCIEHSIPQTFFDPRFLNAEQYANTEVTPGSLYPTKNIPGGKGVSDGFYSLQTATVSSELAPFGASINEMGQFVSGATPQVWGGSSNSSSRTASQYAMQRNQSLQRLNTPLKMIKNLWKASFAKMIPGFIKDMLEDEKHTYKQNGGLITAVIKKAQMDGKIGEIELDAPDGLPQTADQIKDTIMGLINSNNQQILAAIANPENLPLLAQAIGLDSFTMPGEDDREKQYDEIKQLLASSPIPGAPMMTPMGVQQGQEQASVMPELMVDNHQIEAEICRAWLVGESGRQAKIENPDGYKNVLLHLQIHIQMMQQLSSPPPAPQAPMQQQGDNKMQSPSNKSNLRPVSKTA